MTPALKLSHPESKGFWEVPVLFEDASLLAIDKPAGLLTSPDRYDPNRPNLMKLLHRGIASGVKWATARGLTYLANAHRLDFETSGVLLLAKDKPALIHLANQFGANLPRKTYLALAAGSPPSDAFEDNARLGQHPTRIGLMRVDPKSGKRSLTRFEVGERFKGFTLVRCHPHTGRTHQIRVHLQHRHLPICGDVTYGGHPLVLSSLKRNFRLKPGRTENPLINRTALHAHQLIIAHPVTGAEVTIESPLPHDFQIALKYLRRYALVGQSPLTGEDSQSGIPASH